MPKNVRYDKYIEFQKLITDCARTNEQNERMNNQMEREVLEMEQSLTKMEDSKK